MGRIGLRPEDFWRSTPAEHERILHHWRKREEAEDRRAARIMATIYNLQRSPRSRARSENDFLPTRRKQKSARDMLRAITEHHVLMTGEGAPRG